MQYANNANSSYTHILVRNEGMGQARKRHHAVLLPNGQVLVTEGLDREGNDLDSCELYSPSENAWIDAALHGTRMGRSG
jgi:hypothetical protein